MKISVCINAVGFTGYGLEPLYQDRNCLEWLAAALSRLDGVAGVWLMHGPAEAGQASALRQTLQKAWPSARGVSPEIALLALADDSAAAGFRALADQLPADQAILICSALAPALHPGVANTLVANHHKWHAEYTFADGYPIGMSPELIRPDILGVLVNLAERRKTSLRETDGIFETIRQDINAFEIETDIAPLDMRLLRIRLFCDTRQNTGLCRNLLPLFEKHPEDVPALLHAIQDDQARLRTLPSFFNIQITDACPQACPVCPWAQRGIDVRQPGATMKAAEFLALATKIKDFAPESIISLSMWGEPALHPEIWAIIEGMRSLAPLKLYVETAGLGWDPTRLEAFAAGGRHDHVTWIISLDAIDQASYAAMRGEGWQEALAAAHLFVKLFPRSAYIQAVRTQLNDPTLQAHFQYWQKANGLQIIQKYDHFNGRLPDRRLSDIAPLKRLACWHLKRDMAIRTDGTVVLCKQDLPMEAGGQPQLVAGNALSGDLATIWQALEGTYRQQLAGEYLGICGKCDEYYTFNN